MITRVDFEGWEECLRLANERLELICTTTAGPRILRMGAPDGPNFFWREPGANAPRRDGTWHIYGGHRIWHGPEDQQLTYQPDNDPVTVDTPAANRVLLTSPVEAATGAQKSLEIALHDSLPWVSLAHRITNRGLWTVTLAPWGISAMAPGGEAVLPQPPYVSHDEQVAPDRTLVLWSYTNLDDPRLVWGEREIRIKHDAHAGEPTKIGTRGGGAVAWYVHPDFALCKTLSQVEGAEYADLGSAVEVYSCDAFLELETLGPLETLEPGQSAVLREDWLALPGSMSPLSEEEAGSLPLPLRRAYANRPEV